MAFPCVAIAIIARISKLGFEIFGTWLLSTSPTASYSYSSYRMESKGGDVQVFREFTVTLVRPPPWVRLLRCAEGVEVP